MDTFFFSTVVLLSMAVKGAGMVSQALGHFQFIDLESFLIDRILYNNRPGNDHAGSLPEDSAKVLSLGINSTYERVKNLCSRCQRSKEENYT